MRHPVASVALAALLIALAEPTWAQAGSSATDLAPRGGPRYPRDPDGGRRAWRHERGPPRAGGWWGPGGGWMVQEPSLPSLFFAPAIPLPMLAPPSGAAWMGAGLPGPGEVFGGSVSGPGPPPVQFWYWCADPRGYYPAVPTCNGPWQELAATQTR